VGAGAKWPWARLGWVMEVWREGGKEGI
jgi:hypothetical protein